ncbi:hypothetical protein GLOIN_2v1782198 [Rhizophagus irregularis DAOM 181602=DAOM 197198]|uniref:Uncharacterized protein n=1 Tax=Rhizophagus irregularis (strain DAOM 181602 / DAOM 197198 / MUCL 43194) TaxID=747089 RepID=A0A2P4PI37_RHIID|nr:hypothetical protein GLOIN_2v1782198 [Rhizophagus irregularis DAOM 181602=DAOM 197198]POG65017.1 hypothetical protein GLOIN_2v1782198 [Rhizophagus irregularis DAOM 181602=DAOM 197198]|eukprot:XP_025171883.1 hypothetical protein GLOIN_2v1782198 [Rhizophagus irregularis DAOM 181602=DAOM 197198]
MQSTDSLRELNAKLLVEIAKLRKENAEIPELKKKLLKFAEDEVENVRLKQIIEENARRDAENVELKSRVRELETRLALLEQGSAVNEMLLLFGQTQNGDEAMPTVDVPNSVIDQLNNEAYKKSISNEIREKRREKKQKDQKALVISQDVTKIPEVIDMLTSEQDEQDLSQSYEANSESIKSASCVLSKQPQELKSDLHDEVIAKLDKNIIMEQELKQQLSSPAHTSTSDQTLEEQDPSLDTAQNIVCMFRKANKLSQEAILYWCYFIEKYNKRIDNLVVGGVKKKTATSIVYQEIRYHVSSVINSHNETVKILHDQSHVTSKINPTNAYISPKAKTLDQYPTLYREFSSENFDYYGITDETSCEDRTPDITYITHV